MKCHSDAERDGNSPWTLCLSSISDLRRKLRCFELLNTAMSNTGFASEEMRVACGKAERRKWRACFCRDISPPPVSHLCAPALGHRRPAKPDMSPLIVENALGTSWA